MVMGSSKSDLTASFSSPFSLKWQESLLPRITSTNQFTPSPVATEYYLKHYAIDKSSHKSIKTNYATKNRLLYGA
jgi:hypothetical protein